MRIRYSNPLDALLNLQRELEDSRFSDWFGLTTGSRGAFPPLNVFRENDDFLVTTELPGAKKEDLTIEVHRNQLRIAGNRNVVYKEGSSLHRAERKSKTFDRTITIPSDLDPNNVSAEYKNGILKIHLSRAEHEKPRTVKVA
uniref:HSP20 family protein n=1 Tax=Candidatus Kentrum sp. TUN TaxID=2126343 RepID=A0A451AMN8_9GAMM|nr:MAG: HSP20 family protein [Candidatus Kentron sp. TUN]VFK64411.1 MAG: HSP20 family protein [Candidatus Kentron sp. TUN]VFK67285.1 MAG: HSP20 family protein [Candidatus Kentron sp. TUN]